MQYIDIHTHSINQKADNKIQLINLFADNFNQIFPETQFTIGLHPWHIENCHIDDCILNIENAGLLKNMIAVGECGLDRAVSTSFSLQEEYLRKQIFVADKLHKPVIIHCVRAYSELIRLKKEINSEINWVIHGYNGNTQITNELLKNGFYFSVGMKFLEGKRANEILKLIPLERLFFETDDRDYLIESVYNLYSEIMDLEINNLKVELYRNFKKIFLSGY